MRALHAYHWPGNVRELENALERAALVSPGNVIEPSAFPERVLHAAPEPLVRDRPHDVPTLEIVERAYIKWVLDTHGGNKSRAADVLGIDPSTLHRKLQKFGAMV
jgi:DNA-binding NtrC family response regulator